MSNFSYGPRGGYMPGYNDPLSRPFGRMPGMMSGMAFGPGLPNAGQMPQIPGLGGKPYAPGGGDPNKRKSIGSYLTGALDWLTDEDQGAGRANLLLGGLGLGLNYFGARDDRREERRQTEREEGFEDEQRARMAALQPIMTPALVEMLRKRQGGD